MRGARRVFAAMLFSSVGAWADPNARLTQDVTVGPAHDVPLKANQPVQVMKQTGGTDVIMVQLQDGSTGVYQVDAAIVEMTAPKPAPPPLAPVAVAPPPAPSSATATTSTATVAAPATPSPAPAPTEPPTYPNDFVGGPEFDTTAGQQSAGTASVVKLEGGTQSYIVSARHLLGPDGGFATQTPADQVPAFVQSIRIESFSGGSHHYNVTGLLVPTNRLKADGGDPVDDMAIYQNHDADPQDQAVALADRVPAVGTPVWVVARVRGGVPEGQIMQSGVVKWNDKWLVMQFDNDNIITAGASGAPVLNAAGEVVGVYSGHSKENGHVLGFIIPATLIADVIKKAPPIAP